MSENQGLLIMDQPTQTALFNVAAIAVYFLAASIVALLARTLARPIVIAGRRLPGKPPMESSRQKTLESLIASLITLLAFIVAIFAAFSLFVDSDRLIWIVGLFSAGFGLAARSLVSDVLAGTRFIFRNTFTIGEKVELTVGSVTVVGNVEEVNVTNTLVRSMTGEAHIVPNGEIVVITNYSRAPYSSARIKINISSAQLALALDTLEQVALAAPQEMPDISEPFSALSTSDTMGNKVELTIIAHCLYGKAAAVKLRLMELVYRRLREAGVDVID